MMHAPRARLPWFLIAASLTFAALLLYLLFSAYLPTKHRARQLEAELKALYAQEAELQTQLVEQQQRHALREQRVRALTAERDALARRVRDLEREIAPARTPPRR